MSVKRALGVAVLLMVASKAAAHDTFIMPETFRVSKGQDVTIAVHSADGFPESSSLAKDLRDGAVYTAGGRLGIDTFRVDGDRRLAGVKVTAAGHLIVVVRAPAATIALKPDVFRSYLDEEGLTQVVEARAQRGESEKPGRERYAMYAKAILLADAGDDNYKRVVGWPIEFVPQQDPYQVRSSGVVTMQVLVRGVPAAGLQVRAGSATKAGNKVETIGRTDANGNIAVPVTAGKWRLHAIHMERASDAEVEWESLWGTLTFEIQ